MKAYLNAFWKVLTQSLYKLKSPVFDIAIPTLETIDENRIMKKIWMKLLDYYYGIKK
jgi:hypothetical protein